MTEVRVHVVFGGKHVEIKLHSAVSVSVAELCAVLEVRRTWLWQLFTVTCAPCFLLGDFLLQGGHHGSHRPRNGSGDMYAASPMLAICNVALRFSGVQFANVCLCRFLYGACRSFCRSPSCQLARPCFCKHRWLARCGARSSGSRVPPMLRRQWPELRSKAPRLHRSRHSDRRRLVNPLKPHVRAAADQRARSRAIGRAAGTG
jgi:hypothetical protein